MSVNCYKFKSMFNNSSIIICTHLHNGVWCDFNYELIHNDYVTNTNKSYLYMSVDEIIESFDKCEYKNDYIKE